MNSHMQPHVGVVIENNEVLLVMADQPVTVSIINKQSALKQARERMPLQTKDFMGDKHHKTYVVRGQVHEPVKKKVVVISSGGNIQSLHASDSTIDVQVVDYDELMAGGLTEQAADEIRDKALQEAPIQLPY